MYHVYVLSNLDDRIYIGHTEHLGHRLGQHQRGEGGWTKWRGPWELVLSEDFDTRAEAMKREKALKTGRLNQNLRQAVRERSSMVARVLPRKD
jgi:predicted GIY-YIG superfamily endonuclease